MCRAAIPGSEETDSIPFPATVAPLRVQGGAARPPGHAGDLEALGPTRIDQVARSAVVPQDRLQRAAGIDHEAQPVLADVGILPADESLTAATRLRGPEDDEQAAGRRCPTRSLHQGLTVEPEHRLGVAVDHDLDPGRADVLADRPGVRREAGTAGPERDAAFGGGDEVRIVRPEVDQGGSGQGRIRRCDRFGPSGDGRLQLAGGLFEGGSGEPAARRVAERGMAGRRAGCDSTRPR